MDDPSLLFVFQPRTRAMPYNHAFASPSGILFYLFFNVKGKTATPCSIP